MKTFWENPFEWLLDKWFKKYWNDIKDMFTDIDVLKQNIDELTMKVLSQSQSFSKTNRIVFKNI